MSTTESPFLRAASQNEGDVYSATAQSPSDSDLSDSNKRLPPDIPRSENVDTPTNETRSDASDLDEFPPFGSGQPRGKVSHQISGSKGGGGYIRPRPK